MQEKIFDIDDTANIKEYHVFPGVWVALKSVHTKNLENRAEYPDDLLEITYCQKGRLEYESDQWFFCLGKGDMAIHKSSKNHAALHCPTGHYHGISVILDPKPAQAYVREVLEDEKIDLEGMYERFCPREEYFMMQSNYRLEHIFSELYSVPEGIRFSYFKVKMLELILFLSYLDPKQSKTEQKRYTKADILRTRQVFAFVNEHRSEHITISELSREFRISAEQLKRSFASVYGKSVYRCIRAYKMYRAAEVLLETNRTITDVAGEFGYDNSSKFAKAFRDSVGISPAEYRKREQQHREPTLHFGAKND